MSRAVAMEVRVQLPKMEPASGNPSRGNDSSLTSVGAGNLAASVGDLGEHVLCSHDFGVRKDVHGSRR